MLVTPAPVMHLADSQKILSAWRSAILNYEHMKETVLALLAHPDATDEQIMTVRRSYMDACKRMTEAQDELIAKLGPAMRAGSLQLPKLPGRKPR